MAAAKVAAEVDAEPEVVRAFCMGECPKPCRCCNQSCHRCSTGLPFWRDICRACSGRNMAVCGLGDFAFADESALRRPELKVKVSAATNYLVYRKSLLVTILFCAIVHQTVTVLSAVRTGDDINAVNETFTFGKSGTVNMQEDCESFCQLLLGSAGTPPSAATEQSCLTMCLSMRIGGTQSGLGNNESVSCSVDYNVTLSNSEANYTVECSTVPGYVSPVTQSIQDINDARAYMNLAFLFISFVLTICALHTWNDLRISGRYMAAAWALKTFSPYFCSFLPWVIMQPYDLESSVMKSSLYSVNPTAARVLANARVAFPIYSEVAGALLPVFPAIIVGAEVVKTIVPAASVWASLLFYMPVLCFAFNYPSIALLFQMSARWYVLAGGILYAGSKLQFTVKNDLVRDARAYETAHKNVKTLHTQNLMVLLLGALIVIAGFIYDISKANIEAPDREFPLTLMDIISLTCSYFTGYYLSLVATIDGLMQMYGLMYRDDQYVSTPAMKLIISHLYSPVFQKASWQCSRCNSCCRRGSIILPHDDEAAAQGAEKA